MIALDTDVLTALLYGEPGAIAQLSTYPQIEISLPVVAVEEVLRGRLSLIRRAESGRGRLSITEAYRLFAEAVADTRAYQILLMTDAAEALVKTWRSQKIRIGTHDLRIAAICISQGATLVTRNVRDFHRIPGLDVDEWS